MKLKYERFENLGCLYIRGSVDHAQLKMLMLGIDTIVSRLTEPLVINMHLAKIDKGEAMVLSEVKKRIQTHTSHKIYWIAHERPLGDFPTIDLLTSRLPGTNFKQIGERIKRDDEVSTLTLETEAAHAKILELGGDENNAKQIMMENTILKAQKKMLESCIHWQQERMKLQVAIPSLDEEIQQKIKTQEQDLHKKVKLEVKL